MTIKRFYLRVQVLRMRLKGHGTSECCRSSHRNMKICPYSPITKRNVGMFTVYEGLKLRSIVVHLGIINKATISTANFSAHA